MEFSSFDDFLESIKNESDINIDIVDIDYEQAHYSYKSCIEIIEDSYFGYYSEEILIVKPNSIGYYPIRFMETMGIKYIQPSFIDRVKNNKDKSKNKKRKHRY